MQINGEDATNLTNEEIIKKLRELPSSFSRRTKQLTQIDYSGDSNTVNWRSEMFKSIKKLDSEETVDCENISHLLEIPDNKQDNTRLIKANNIVLLVKFLVKLKNTHLDCTNIIHNFQYMIAGLETAIDIWKENKCWDKEYSGLCILYKMLALQRRHVTSNNKRNELQKISSTRIKIAEIHHKRGMERTNENAFFLYHRAGLEFPVISLLAQLI